MHEEDVPRGPSTAIVEQRTVGDTPETYLDYKCSDEHYLLSHCIQLVRAPNAYSILSTWKAEVWCGT